MERMEARSSGETLSLSVISGRQASEIRSRVIREWLVRFGTNHERAITPLIPLWEDELADVSPALLEKVFRQVIRTSRFFPTIADIRAQVDEVDEKGRELETEHAWQHALGWIGRYYHPDIGISRGAPELSAKITHAIRAAGGMHMLFCCSESDVVWRKRDFIADYSRTEELGRNEHLMSEGAAKRILATLQAGPPQSKREQLAPAREPSIARPSKSEVRAVLADVRAVLDKTPLTPTATVDAMSDEEFERRKREQQERLAAWKSARAKNTARVAT